MYNFFKFNYINEMFYIIPLLQKIKKKKKEKFDNQKFRFFLQPKKKKCTYLSIGYNIIFFLKFKKKKFFFFF